VKAGTRDNIITLTGHVRTWAGHDAVVSATWMANGVNGVRGELHVTG
jgi:osmotically-inducible protein OsmY